MLRHLQQKLPPKSPPALLQHPYPQLFAQRPSFLRHFQLRCFPEHPPPLLYPEGLLNPPRR